MTRVSSADTEMTDILVNSNNIQPKMNNLKGNLDYRYFLEHSQLGCLCRKSIALRTANRV